ncbi:MAG: acyl-CoA dehydrogenase family protein [Candidatus Aminicenantia bacterium]
MKKGGSFLLEPVVGEIFTREKFNEEQKEIDKMVHDFAREKIFPHKEELGELNKELSLKLMREASGLGLAAIDIPEKYGGMELDKTTSVLVVEALATGQSASWIVTFSAHVGIGTLPIVFFGTEEQKQRYLPKLASVEYLGAYALTEPGAGSDALNIKTNARLSDDGKYYILNGTKQYITNGGWADLFIVFTKIDRKDFTAFIVERSASGLSIETEEQKMGIKGSSTTSVILENCQVPVENLLGKRGEGHHIAFNILNIGRFKLGAADLGGCKSCINSASQYAIDRKQFGQPIAFFDAIRKKFADMVVRTYMLDSAIYRTVGMMDDRISTLNPDDADYNVEVMKALEEYAIESSISKILGSETLFRVSDHGIQIYGGYGFSEEYPMAIIFRDTRIDRIFEGTNEINRMVIYGYYLKKALLEELPLRDVVKSWNEYTPTANGPFACEINALDAARRLTLKCLDQAICLYGQDLRNEQVVGEDLADLIIGYYAASSALSRILQLGPKAHRDRAIVALARLTVATYLEDAWRLFYRLKPILFSGHYGMRLVENFERLRAVLELPFDPVTEVRILTDDLYHHQHYRFE